MKELPENKGSIAGENTYHNPTLGMTISLPGAWHFFDGTIYATPESKQKEMADRGVPHVPPLQVSLLGGRMAPTLGPCKIGVPLDKSGGVVRDTSLRNAMKHRLPTPQASALTKLSSSPPIISRPTDLSWHLRYFCVNMSCDC